MLPIINAFTGKWILMAALAVFLYKQELPCYVSNMEFIYLVLSDAS